MQTLLNDSRAAGMFVALVTSSEKVVTEELLKIAKLDSFFDLVLTRDDCPKHKPDPWPYIKAQEISGFDKDETCVSDQNLGPERRFEICEGNDRVFISQFENFFALRQKCRVNGKRLRQALVELTRAYARREFGALTAGAVLASQMFPISEKFMLQFPLMDYVTIKGYRIEGNGLKVDEEAAPPKLGEEDRAILLAQKYFGG